MYSISRIPSTLVVSTLVLASAMAGMAQDNQVRPDATDCQFFVYALYGDMVPGGPSSPAVALCRKAFLYATTGDDALATEALESARTADGGRHKLLFKRFADYIAETKKYALGGISIDDPSAAPGGVWMSDQETVPQNEEADFSAVKNIEFALSMVKGTSDGRPLTISVGMPAPGFGPLAPETTQYPLYDQHLADFKETLANAEQNHFLTHGEEEFAYEQSQVTIDQLKNKIADADVILGKECDEAHQAGNAQLEAELLVRRGDNLVFTNDSWRSLAVDLSIDDAYRTALSTGTANQYRTPGPQEWASAKSYFQQAMAIETRDEAKTDIELRLSLVDLYTQDPQGFGEHFMAAGAGVKKENRPGFLAVLDAERAMFKREKDSYNQDCDGLVKLGEESFSRGLLHLTIGWAYRQQYLLHNYSVSIPTALLAERTSLQLHDFPDYEATEQFISDVDSDSLGRDDEAIVERKEEYQLLAKDLHDYFVQNPGPSFQLPLVQHEELQEIGNLKDWLLQQYVFKYEMTGDDSWVTQIDDLRYAKDGAPLGKKTVLDAKIAQIKLLADIKNSAQNGDDYWSQVASHWNEFFAADAKDELETERVLNVLCIADAPSAQINKLVRQLLVKADPYALLERSVQPNPILPEAMAVGRLDTYFRLALSYRNFDLIHDWIDHCESNPDLAQLKPLFDYDKTIVLFYEGNASQGIDCLHRLEAGLEGKDSPYVSQSALLWLDEVAAVLTSDAKTSLLDHEKLRLAQERWQLQGMGVDPNQQKSAERAMELRNLANGAAEQNIDLTQTILGQDRPMPIPFGSTNYTQQDLDKIIAGLPSTTTLVFYDLLSWNKRVVTWVVSGADKSIKLELGPESATDFTALNNDERSGLESMEHGVKLLPADTQRIQDRFAGALSGVPAGNCVGVEWSEPFPIEYLTGSDGIPLGMKYGLYRFPTVFDVASSPQWPCLVDPQTSVTVLKGDSEFAGDEVASIGRFFHTSVLETKAGVETATFTPQVLHVVGHCGFNNANPFASYILLGGDPLSAWELFGRMPVMPLMVFSACDTGAKDASTNENFAWIASAGRATWTVSTLWEVDDAGAADMMARFYSHLHDGTAIPVALADARRENKEHYGPRVYDAFVLSSQGPILARDQAPEVPPPAP